MLDRFLKPRWDSPRAQTRIQALQRMSSGDPLIAQMAANDSEPLVRREATSRLGDLGLLVSIARKDLDQGVRETAWDRFVALMELPVLSPEDHQNRVNMLQEIPLATILTRIIRSQAELALKQAAIHALQDEMHLEEIALHSSVSILRCTAAERIQSEAILKVLEQESRQRDKQVHRISREKLDEFEQNRRIEQERNQKIKDLKAQIIQLSQSSFQPMYQARADYLKQCWHVLDHEDLDVTQAISHMEDKCRQHWEQERINLHRRQLITTVQQLLAVRPDNEQLLSWINDILGHREVLSHNLELLNPSLRELCQPIVIRLNELATWWEHWQRLEAQALVTADVDLFNQRLQALRDAPFDSQALLESLQRPVADHPSENDSEVLPVTTPETDPRAAHETGMSEQEWQDSLNKIEQLIDEGHSEHAMRLWHRLGRYHPHLHAQKERVQNIERRLHEWRDWHSFAVLPKKQQLLDEMKRLEDSDTNPQTLWQQERRIQRSWRELGVVDHQKELPLWQEFSATSARIRERCKPWRDEQQRLVEQARQNADELCKQLQPIETRDLDRQSWKNLRDSLSRFQEQWKSIRRHLRESEPVTAAVRAELDRLNQAILREERQNRKSMLDLVEKAQSILKKDQPVKDTLSEIRKLQLAWKDIGLHRHRDNQELWPQFKTACDQVYQRSQQQQESCKDLIQQLDPESADFDLKMQSCRELLANMELTGSLKEMLQQKEQMHHRVLARHRNQALSKQKEDAWNQLVAAHQSNLDLNAKTGLLPNGWRKVSEPFQTLNAKHALLLWEYILDLEAPAELQHERRNLLLQLWKDGLTSQQLGQQHAQALAAKVLLYPWPPTDQERVYRCFQKAWPKEPKEIVQ